VRYIVERLVRFIAQRLGDLLLDDSYSLWFNVWYEMPLNDWYNVSLNNSWSLPLNNAGDLFVEAKAAEAIVSVFELVLYRFNMTETGLCSELVCLKGDINGGLAWNSPFETLSNDWCDASLNT
jgi:hypothetical protein